MALDEKPGGRQVIDFGGHAPGRKAKLRRQDLGRHRPPATKAVP